ncbi:MAG: type IV conjugative transfer system protein TraL [Deltaproteobacteria bacterium]|nr:type IV conjugative transfer system protein TraL [Deltaproteobacteria bacterium]
MGRKRFPQYLSDPLQVLWFEPDELSMMFIFFGLAMVYGSFFWILMVLVPWFYSRAKRKYPKGFLKHMLYFIGILNIKGYPIFFEDTFIE